MTTDSLASGPSSFEIQNMSGGGGHRSGGNMAATGGSGTAATVGKAIWEGAKNANIDLGVKGLGTVFHIPGVSESNILDVFDGAFISPGNINGLAGTGEFKALGNLSIKDAVAGIGAEIEGHTSIVAKGGGRE